MQKKSLIVLIILGGFMLSCVENTNKELVEVQKENLKNNESQTKPWTRWWWMGSAVDSVNIKQNLIDLHRVGIGGVEIAPIYGVKGEEDNFIDYLSPKWMNMLSYTTKVADSLGMQVDLTLGTGWPYGGPQVTAKHAATKLITQTYSVEKEASFSKEIRVENPKEKRPATLKFLLAFGDNGNYIDLTEQVKENQINWIADDDYTVYAIFTGKTGQKVKRAAPGGAGFTLDHYSEEALNAYVQRFGEALIGFDGNIRSIFNDSYEVYGTNFTPKFFEAFEQYRGYDLKPYIPLLLSEEDTEEGNRVKSDYRETLSDLLLNDFDKPWTAWANKHNFKSRLQAHGSPGNLIDLYASADIPECETFGSMPYDIPGLRREQEDIREGDADPVMLKFSSSAAHIAGKPLTSSETFTWLRDHFKVALSQCKPELEDLFVNGVNHIFLHGTTYSPKRADWPGWKFYASVNFNPNLAIGEDEAELFSYIANCQKYLQAGKPDNETLLYWPIYDVWNTYLKGSLFFQFKIHSLEEWLHHEPFYKTTKDLMAKGYATDFISDEFIKKATVSDGKIKLPGGEYKSLIVPDCKHMPLATLEKLLALKNEGAHIIFEDLPETVPGFHNYKAENESMQKLIANNSKMLVASKDIFRDLDIADVQPETLVETGLKYIRRDIDGEKIYYLVNHTANLVKGYVPTQIIEKEVELYDANQDKSGKAITKVENGKTWVMVSIKPGESLFLKSTPTSGLKYWEYLEPLDTSYKLNGNWNISFLRGGPTLPESANVSKLESWTNLSQAAEGFSGTAIYGIKFENPDSSVKSWQLNLGDVRESAKVWLNGKYLGAVWANPFEINIGELKEGLNQIEIEVTNLSANRVRAKELRGEEWKNFYEINMVNKDYQKFDATKWEPMPSGLLGPVSLTPLKAIKN